MLTVRHQLEEVNPPRDGRLACARAAVPVVADVRPTRNVHALRLRADMTMPPRLSEAEVRAIRRASQRQLTRWAKVQLDAEGRQRSAELRLALRTLRMFRDGCELHPVSDRDVRDRARAPDNASY